MSKISSSALLVPAIVVVALMALVLYFRAAPMQASVPEPLPAALEVVDVLPAAPQAAAAPAELHSWYISEQTLRHGVELAGERHWDARAQALLHILNDRYTRRCCGLPW